MLSDVLPHPVSAGLSDSSVNLPDGGVSWMPRLAEYQRILVAIYRRSSHRELIVTAGAFVANHMFLLATDGSSVLSTNALAPIGNFPLSTTVGSENDPGKSDFVETT